MSKYRSVYDTSPQGLDICSHSRRGSTNDDQMHMLSKVLPPPEYETYHPPQCDPRPFDIAAQLPPSNHTLRVLVDDSRTAAPYQEAVFWTNPTHFRSLSANAVKTDHQRQTSVAFESLRLPRQYLRNARHLREPWRPGLWWNLPWRGLGALFTIVLLTGASATILFLSNGMSPTQWKIGNDSVQPQVYIAIFEMLMNLLMFCALVEGITINFWRRLLHGTTIAAMHETYASTFLWTAVGGLFRLRLNTVAIASLIASLSYVRGPLFQRALTIEDGVYRTNNQFIIVGIIVSITGVLAILSLFYRYWDLGRKVSLDPLELARAFGAPLFDGLDGNATATDIEIEHGSVIVRYGAVERYGGEKVLRIEDASRSNVRMPWDGEIFG